MGRPFLLPPQTDPQSTTLMFLELNRAFDVEPCTLDVQRSTSCGGLTACGVHRAHGFPEFQHEENPSSPQDLLKILALLQMHFSSNLCVEWKKGATLGNPTQKLQEGKKTLMTHGPCL